MQFNVQWLKQWVDVDLDAAAIADRLTASGLEVDDVRGVAADFTDVVVAEIASCAPHPNADKLSLCTVDDGGAATAMADAVDECKELAERLGAPVDLEGLRLRLPATAAGTAGFSAELGAYVDLASLGAVVVKSLAQEGARKGVTANTVSPGYIESPMVNAVPEDIRNQIIAQIPRNRLGRPADIARTVVFLAADDADFITGANIPVNGGHYMS